VDVKAFILLVLTFRLITTSLYSGSGHLSQDGLGQQVVSLFYPATLLLSFFFIDFNGVSSLIWPVNAYLRCTRLSESFENHNLKQVKDGNRSSHP
jgi:hypothetical protein